MVCLCQNATLCDRIDIIMRHFQVPVIAVFTKFDQFKRDIRMKLADEGRDRDIDLDAETENIFNRHYLAMLNGPPPFIRLEKMQKHGQQCLGLIEMTANALSDSAVALMLVAVQRDNLELSIKQAVRRCHHVFEQQKGSSVIKKIIRWTHRDVGQGDGSTEAIIKICILSFPSLWYWLDEELEDEELFDEESLFLRLLFLEREFSSDAKILLSKLQSFNSNLPPSLCISRDNTHHTMIVAILILDRVSILYVSPSQPTLMAALDQACLECRSSDTHNAVKEQYSLPPKEYSILQFTEFVLSHRLR